MVRYLIDTNIFLEILLDQEKSHECRDFLSFYHSIGLILLKRKRSDLYADFIDDVLPLVNLVSLPIERFSDFAATYKDRLLDYDDFYQYWIAVEEGLTLVTLDSDFKKVEKTYRSFFYRT